MASASSSSSSSSSSVPPAASGRPRGLFPPPFLLHVPDVGRLVHDHLSGLADRFDLLRHHQQQHHHQGPPLQQHQRHRHAPCRVSAQPHGSHRGFYASLSLSSIAEPEHLFDIALSQEQVSKALEGVLVYTVSNAGNEFVLVSDPNGTKSLSLLCFRQQDAESLLSQVRDREPVLGREAKVVAVSLDKVYKLTAEGIAFRFLPDPTQVKNAIEAKVKSGEKGRVFDGVPVFQSENLILRSSNRRYIPIYFRKEDLEKALAKASREQKRASGSLRANMNIQVGSFEDVLKKLEVNDESSGWGDFIFVPPGKDAVQHLGRAVV